MLIKKLRHILIKNRKLVFRFYKLLYVYQQPELSLFDSSLGHSKEGRTGQRIFSVAVVISPLLGIPIATLVYEGNKNDKTAMKEFYSELETRLKGIVDLGKITFVFDGGGFQKRT